MKILLATDGSDHSKAAIEELARMPFPAGTKVRIVSAFENTPLITSAPAPMGGLARGLLKVFQRLLSWKKLKNLAPI